MLKIAVPNKGSLAEPAAQMLREAGYRQRRDARELVMTDPANDVEFFYLRPRDIAVYVGEGTLDVGLTGRDLLLDSRAPVEERLSWASASRRSASPRRRDGSRCPRTSTARASPRRTPVCSRTGSRSARSTRKVVRLDGAVESAVRLGVADAIADVVETGTTLRAGRARGLR